MFIPHRELIRQFLVPSTATLTSVLRKHGLGNTWGDEFPLMPREG